MPTPATPQRSAPRLACVATIATRAVRALAAAVALGAIVLGCSHSPTGPGPPPRALPRFYNDEPAWSPDGTSLLFLHYPETPEENLNGGFQIWRYDFASGLRQFLCAGYEPKWAGNDAFTFTVYPEYQIYRYSFATGMAAPIVACDGFSQWGSTAPDGHVLAFGSNCSSNNDAILHLKLLDLMTHEVHTIPGQDSVAWCEPAWSPDGHQLAHTRFNPVTGFHLFVMDTSGVNAVALGSDGTDDYGPAWSHAGDWIYVVRVGSSQSIRNGLWRIHPDGSQPEFVMPDVYTFTISPLDTALVIAKVDSATNSLDLWASTPTGTEQRRLFMPKQSPTLRAQQRAGFAPPTSSTRLEVAHEVRPNVEPRLEPD